MTALTTTVQNVFSKNERATAISIGVVMLALVVLMGLVSLTMLNDKATKGYLLNKLEEERQALVTDGEITDTLTLRARSMSVIEDSSVVQNMRKPERKEIDYVAPVAVVAQQ